MATPIQAHRDLACRFNLRISPVFNSFLIIQKRITEFTEIIIDICPFLKQLTKADAANIYTVAG